MRAPSLRDIMVGLGELLEGADFAVTLDNYKRDSYPGEVLNLQIRTRRKASKKEHELGLVIRLDEGPEASAFLIADAIEKTVRHHRKLSELEEPGS